MKKSLSLLEMVVSLLVMSVIVATSLKYGSSAYSQYKYSANQKKLENIQTALKNYFKAHGRLPRPSPYNNLTTTDDKYGKELEINSGCTDMSCREITDTIVYSNKKIQYSKMQANKGATNADKVDGTYNNWVQYTANDYMFSGIVPFKELHLTEKDICLSILPLNHVLEGLFCMLQSIYEGLERVFCNEIDEIIDYIKNWSS